MPEDLANPIILCGWSALLDALSLINHKDRAMALLKIPAEPIQAFVARQQDMLMKHNFPDWTPPKSKEKVPNPPRYRRPEPKTKRARA